MGEVIYSAAYSPYGKMLKKFVDKYEPTFEFSGKEREYYSEMDYFGARYYGYKMFRFASVDPIRTRDAAIMNPQKWNLYAYCDNNPTTLFDPDGRRVWPYYNTYQTQSKIHGRRVAAQMMYNETMFSISFHAAVIAMRNPKAAAALLRTQAYNQPAMAWIAKHIFDFVTSDYSPPTSVGGALGGFKKELFNLPLDMLIAYQNARVIRYKDYMERDLKMYHEGNAREAARAGHNVELGRIQKDVNRKVTKLRKMRM